MAITLLNSVGWAPGPGGGYSVTFNTTGASLIIVSVSWYAGGGFINPTLTDTKGNTYTALTVITAGTIGNRLFYVNSPITDTFHQIQIVGTSFYPYGVALAYNGTSLSSPFDVQNGGTVNSNGPLSTGSITPSVNGSLIISSWAGMNATSNPTIGSGLTIQRTSNPVGGVNVAGATGDLIQTTAATINPSWSWTGSDWVAAIIASFKPVTVSSSGGERTQLSVGLG